ncbi:MAG: hypothetical protein CL421_00580 [Acidimicrobiaceae bacterium]|nr:hypothetical protein [Acidimicrobiaceae bacterium]
MPFYSPWLAPLLLSELPQTLCCPLSESLIPVNSGSTLGAFPRLLSSAFTELLLMLFSVNQQNLETPTLIADS